MEWSLILRYSSDLQVVGSPLSGQVCYSPQHWAPLAYTYVSDSGGLSTGGRCTITTLAAMVDVHVSPVSLAEQCHSETSSHSEHRSRSF